MAVKAAKPQQPRMHPAGMFDDVDFDTAVPCPKCMRELESPGPSYEGMRGEWVMPLPKFPPRDENNEQTCRDCDAAWNLVRMRQVPSFQPARVAVGNDRQEQIRLPGAPLGLAFYGLIRPNRDGDLLRLLEWQDKFPRIVAAKERD